MVSSQYERIFPGAPFSVFLARTRSPEDNTMLLVFLVTVMFGQMSNQKQGLWEGQGRSEEYMKGISGGIITCTVIGMKELRKVVMPM